MQNILLSIACTNTPQQAGIVLIDPKLGVDYFAFEGLPHLREGVIDNQEAAISALNQLVIEMDRRYRVLKENRVSNIFDLNIKEGASEKLPFLWVIHDEFAEWMMTTEYGEAVSEIVSRLGVKARAAGIFLVFAAQRPDAVEHVRDHVWHPRHHGRRDPDRRRDADPRHLHWLDHCDRDLQLSTDTD